jgi:hypothetical protein
VATTVITATDTDHADHDGYGRSAAATTRDRKLEGDDSRRPSPLLASSTPIACTRARCPKGQYRAPNLDASIASVKGPRWDSMARRGTKAPGQASAARLARYRKLIREFERATRVGSGEPLGVAEFCATSGISRRTLLRGPGRAWRFGASTPASHAPRPGQNDALVDECRDRDSRPNRQSMQLSPAWKVLGPIPEDIR